MLVSQISENLIYSSLQKLWQTLLLYYPGNDRLVQITFKTAERKWPILQISCGAFLKQRKWHPLVNHIIVIDCRPWRLTSTYLSASTAYGLGAFITSTLCMSACRGVSNHRLQCLSVCQLTIFHILECSFYWG